MVFRRINLWYWKISERTKLLEVQNDLLAEIAANVHFFKELKLLELNSSETKIMVTHKGTGKTETVSYMEWLSKYNNDFYISILENNKQN